MHRRTVSAHRPELPDQATSLYEKFTTAVQLTDVEAAAYEASRGVKRPPRRQEDRSLVPRGLVRPEIDVDKLVQLMIGMAQQRAEADKNRGQSSEGDPDGK
jgi:hypothetical protein